MDSDSGYKDPFRDNFNLNSRFISNNLSMNIRKLKIQTDGEFNMISIAPSLSIEHICRIIGDSALQARVTMNDETYNRMNELNKYEYYLQLLEEGYKICTQYRKIPLDQLLKLHQDFRDKGYKNEWIHKKKKFKEFKIEVILYCFFTSFDFRLVMSVYDDKSKLELVTGTVIRTLPDELCFNSLFKDIAIEKQYLFITDYQNRPKFKFLLSNILNGNFLFEIEDVGLAYEPLSIDIVQ